MPIVLSKEKGECTFPVPPSIEGKDPIDVRNYNYGEKGRYCSLMCRSPERRARIFFTEYWDEEYTKLKWKGSEVNQYKSVLVINMPYDKSYCHNMIDTLPLMLELEGRDEYDLIVFPQTPFLKKFIKEMTFNFKKVLILEDTVSFKTNKIRVENYCMRSRSIKRLRTFKKIIENFKGRILSPDRKKNRFIYCTRNTGGGAMNERKMDDLNEDNIISLCKSYAQKKGLEFTYFNCIKKDGSQMSILDQIKIFDEAKVVMGPHGGAFSNLIFLDPENDCKICEFTSGIRSMNVQAIQPYVKNYDRLYCNLISEYAEYFLIPFSRNSTAQKTNIDLEDLGLFLLKS